MTEHTTAGTPELSASFEDFLARAEIGDTYQVTESTRITTYRVKHLLEVEEHLPLSGFRSLVLTTVVTGYRQPSRAYVSVRHTMFSDANPSGVKVAAKPREYPLNLAQLPAEHCTTQGLEHAHRRALKRNDTI